MPRQRDPNRGMVVAKQAFVWVQGARPPEYEQIDVVDRAAGQKVTMNSDRIVDQGSGGIPFAFKEYQRVPKSHPAVKAKPDYFIDIGELDETELPMVTG